MVFFIYQTCFRDIQALSIERALGRVRCGAGLSIRAQVCVRRLCSLMLERSRPNQRGKWRPETKSHVAAYSEGKLKIEYLQFGWSYRAGSWRKTRFSENAIIPEWVDFFVNFRLSPNFFGDLENFSLLALVICTAHLRLELVWCAAQTWHCMKSDNVTRATHSLCLTRKGHERVEMK